MVSINTNLWRSYRLVSQANRSSTAISLCVWGSEVNISVPWLGVIGISKWRHEALFTCAPLRGVTFLTCPASALPVRTPSHVLRMPPGEGRRGRKLATLASRGRDGNGHQMIRRCPTRGHHWSTKAICCATSSGHPLAAGDFIATLCIQLCDDR